ncbi:MAG: cycloartenol synthase [Verrucomicrobia bacterium]|nr:cycloartenol synthase [Verrucomicrobiota bacterium]
MLHLSWITLASWGVCVLTQLAQGAVRAPDVSFRNEVQNSIQRGLNWLGTQQNSNGWWSTADHPALTALVLSAFQGEPSGRYQVPTEAMLRGYEFIAQSAKPDGGIYVRDLPSYNTSLAILALLGSPSPRNESLIRNARQYLIGLQADRGEPRKLDTPFDGGIGYGGSQRDPDMNNTWTALQALHHSRRWMADQGKAMGKDLNWNAAVHFLESCQNLPERNTQAWVSREHRDRGGFVYHPGRSMAGGETNATTGRVSLRSYGTISYAGLLSYIYADLAKDDPRVTAVRDWLSAHYTLEENPGMGQQGYYYYLHLLAKGLSAAGINEMPLAGGRIADWRRDLAVRLMELQSREGSWANSNVRWWEKDPVLSTSYALLALEIAWRGL